ncbi:MAG TPA: GNAT family N-acetyltransferase [Pyrinomonadaceae bacterium]|nr:GNAT family N-acetyltransferase [Pyrinomonadaceae bacterium]
MKSQDDIDQSGIVIRECTTIEEYDECVRLQREAFSLTELEITPRRHLIVSKRAGGWTLGAFAENRLLGFVLHLIAVRDGTEIIGYSHMMAVAKSAQNRGIGARLKWAQRERALAEARNYIKWTWDPMQARNAHFNLNRLGVTVRSYGVNLYGTDYLTFKHEQTAGSEGLDSDRLFAEWDLLAPRVAECAAGRAVEISASPAAEIVIPPDWQALVEGDPTRARREQLRVRAEFEQAFASGLVCAGFRRDSSRPRYLLYQKSEV